MSMHLGDWQKRLDRRFRSLENLRANSRLPIFALEHGLTIKEIKEISNLLQEHISTNKPLDSYWLVWVVYATEIGYRYVGDEYWQSFEKKTPGWEFHHRKDLRKWFSQFQSSYHGVQPSGSWASQFPIIASPITHAILPKYLQYQFAKALHQLRYRLAGLDARDSLSIGRLFVSHTHNATTRFEKFLQQEELTGRIVLGLLDQSPQKGYETIDPVALQRIVDDLDSVRSTQSWLKETRRTVIDRYRGIGQGTGLSLGRSSTTDKGRMIDQFSQPDLRSAILVKHSGAEKWVVVLEIPNFNPLANLSVDLRTFLKQTRCHLAGRGGAKPAGWTLSGHRVGILKLWPNPEESLLKFEQSHQELDNFLQTDCRMSAGPTWLFRVNADGRAREVRGRNVYPGGEYILISVEEFSVTGSFYSPCVLECEGVFALRISVPKNLSGEEVRQIKALDLEVARTVRVWPAGLLCRGWDGEGQSEWLTTESPRFGLVPDHPVDSYQFRLNDKEEVVISAPPVGEPVFIQLDPLPTGEHRLIVTAQRYALDETVSDELKGYIEINVREPEPWVPGVPAHTGLIVNADPYDADLDKFWENKVSISINGPESHNVKCIVSLENSNGKQIFSESVGSPFQLPVESDKWQEEFSKFTSRENIQRYYWEASGGKLEVQADELGKYVLQFERDVLPVRWVTQPKRRDIFLRLIDDSSMAAGETCCEFYSLEQPLKSRETDLSKLRGGWCPPPPGGLFVARHNDCHDAVVISSAPTGKGFQGLEVSSNFNDIHKGNVSIVNALRILRLWYDARLVGLLTGGRREKITLKLLATIYAKLCGRNWARMEEDFREKPNSKQVVDALQNKVSRNQEFNAILKRDRIKLCNSIDQSSSWYFSLARRYRISFDQVLCEFAVCLACESHRLIHIYKDDLDDLIKQAVSNPEVLRGARYATLLLHSDTDQHE